ncbi:hypothetical protein ACFYWX_47725 [Streptomyces sp. NPDC002888]|uniref:hypothetical protein n=1 Tax=Streptomyces sp. NPDC002888 TaxID=3364668 RepID=UPI00369D31FB
MTSSTPDKITVNGDRLWQSLTDLAEIGAYDDERTGLLGVDRLALTDADAAGRRQVIELRGPRRRPRQPYCDGASRRTAPPPHVGP